MATPDIELGRDEQDHESGDEGDRSNGFKAYFSARRGQGAVEGELEYEQRAGAGGGRRRGRLVRALPGTCHAARALPETM